MMSRPTPFQKGHMLLAILSLAASLLAMLVGWMIDSGHIMTHDLNTIFGPQAIPENFGARLAIGGLYALPVALIWCLIAKFMAW